MYETALFFHFIGLALGVGGGAALAVVGIKSRDWPEAERLRIMEGVWPISYLTATGLVVLILSGLAMYGRWADSLAGTPGATLFGVKMACVAVVLIALGLIHMRTARARRAGTAPPEAQIAILGTVANLFGVAAVVLAVVIFG
jgi:hypothetical protein